MSQLTLSFEYVQMRSSINGMTMAAAFVYNSNAF